jgi:ATP-dependent Clp protease adaptor protein ClpS
MSGLRVDPVSEERDSAGAAGVPACRFARPDPTRTEACGYDPTVAESKTRQQPRHATATAEQLADLWHVVVLNDPVNLMSYVVMVFKKVLGFDETKARKHMLEVHEQGRSVVWSGVREQAEAYVFSLQQWHLTAVLEADERG